MTTETKAKWVLELSLLECLLFLLLLTLLVGGTGVGAGYYLGSAVGNNQLNSVLNLAEDLSDAHKRESHAVQVNYDILQYQLSRYEQFLLGAGIEPTLPLAHKPGMQAAKVSKKQRRAVGGP